MCGQTLLFIVIPKGAINGDCCALAQVCALLSALLVKICIHKARNIDNLYSPA